VTAFLRFELRRALRDLRFLFFLIAFPVLLYLIDSSVGGAAGGGPDYTAGVMVAMAVWSVMGAGMWASGPALCRERASGWLRQLRVTPLSSGGWLTTKLIQGCLMAIPGTVLLAIVATAKDGVTVSAGQWGGLAVLVVLGAIPFVFAGLLIGLRFDAQTGQLVQMLTLMVFAFLGGLFFPVSLMPDALAHVAQALPSYGLSAIGQGILGGHAVHTGDVATVAGWAVALGAAAMWRWHRESSAG